MMTNFDEPTVSKQKVIKVVEERLSRQQATEVLQELGIVKPVHKGDFKVTLQVRNSNQLSPELSAYQLLRRLWDFPEKIVDSLVEPTNVNEPDPNAGDLDKAQVVEIALRLRRKYDWCTEGFTEVMTDLGIRLPPQRVYRVSFDLLEDEVIEFAQSKTVESFTVSSARDFLDEMESETVRGFRMEATDRMEQPNQ